VVNSENLVTFIPDTGNPLIAFDDAFTYQVCMHVVNVHTHAYTNVCMQKIWPLIRRVTILLSII